VELHAFDGRSLPYEATRFDVSFIGYVLHHLSRARALRLVDETIRVTRRKILILGDSMPAFDFVYRLRNRLHRLESDLAYTSRAAFVPTGDGRMFLTHGDWAATLAAVPGVRAVKVEPLTAISKYAHHTLLELELETRPAW
jgi:hypothetical protein